MPAHDHGQTAEPRTAGPTPSRAAARTSVPGLTSPQGLLALQASVGNAAAVQLARRAGLLAAREQHQHDAGCGHPATAAVQRSAVHDVLRTSGRPLDHGTRTDMEARLGADFSNVRVHDDSAAKASAAEVGARAYTSGSHVVIGAGGGDKHTLAHELTHVIQQRTGPVAGTDNGNGLSVSDPSDRFEREAEANATRVMSGPAPEHPVQTAPATGAAQEAAPAVQRASSTVKEQAVVSRYQPSKQGSLPITDLPIERPRQVTGPIQPTGTSGRGAAPEPLSVTSLQSAYKTALKNHHQGAGTRAPRGSTPSNADVWRDLFGGAGYDRGHIMGLEVGGSDVTENIVPQWSLNQQSGEWRDIEKQLVTLGAGQVRFTPHYPSQHGNYRAVMIPTRIDVDVAAGGTTRSTQWHNDPNLNDFFRSGQGPDDLAISYNAAKDHVRPQGGTVTVDENTMHTIASLAQTHERAVATSHAEYVEQQRLGQAPGPSSLASTMAAAGMSDVAKAAREKLIATYISCGWVSKSGANYTLKDADIDDSASDSSSSESESGSESDSSMHSATPPQSLSTQVPFSQMDLGNSSDSYSDDSDYMSD
ncbi:eCIS core domain-containing protein [Kitasatospora viridis]|uniref:Uncharacterized protein DUF4157 n=1 Tax=Kitasatospora viridis TaxID=281105 RepID=A0A561UMX2_9ACTN|nr:DUF4157 domain-containing protein [Kitasatospora viridis]TWG00718.1 uncharacterized protein DUF4157 [Kitasatospora viridis]